MIDITWPSRIIMVGGSESGKTYLMRQMIMRGDLGVSKADLDILVISPVASSLCQPIWRDLKRRGFQLALATCGGASPLVPAPGRKRLLIIDDADHIAEMRFTNEKGRVQRGRDWLLDLFGTESHHSNITVVLICHQLKIGCPGIRNSADAVIITNLPRSELEAVCKELGASPELVQRALAAPEGRVGAGPVVKLYNHIVLWRKRLYMMKGQTVTPMTEYFTLPRKIADPPGLSPFC